MHHPVTSHPQRSYLESGLTALALELEPPQVDGLLQFLDELSHWNRAYNLTAVREPKAMIDRHILDSLAIAPFVPAGRLLDVGAGAGLPGLSLAIVNALLQVELLDSNGKKVRFMRHCIRRLALTNAVVAQHRVESYQPDFPPDCIVARAFAPIERLVELVADICPVGGQILAMRGRDEPFELPSGFKLLENRALKVPRSAAPRHLVILQRDKHNPLSTSALEPQLDG